MRGFGEVDFGKFYSEHCTDEDVSSLSKKEYERVLSADKLDGLESEQDYEHYLDCLRRLRTVEEGWIGEKRRKLLNKLLTAGDEGIYTEFQRFMYELIQNVDDCVFHRPEDCQLTIHFNDCTGEIELEYNEEGFKPRDVFSITNEGDSAKVISNQECIGEKGIGFKSVFGIADKVLIQSRGFSFELYKDHYTIPVPRYNGTKSLTTNTRITLYTSPEKCGGIYDTFAKLYSETDALLKQNPIVFLNKLRCLRMKRIGNTPGYIEFTMCEKPLGKENSVSEVVLGLSRVEGKKDPDYAVKAYRYSKPIHYDKAACVSKFGMGDDCPEMKDFKLSAIFPQDKQYLIEENGVLRKHVPKKGMLYCFLPSATELEVPVIINAPFQMNSSREYVKYLSDNAAKITDWSGKSLEDLEGSMTMWFCHTIREMSTFIKECYSDVSRRARQRTLYYIPPKGVSLFAYKKNHTECMRIEHHGVLNGNELRDGDYLPSEDGTWQNCQNVVCVDRTYKETLSALRILGESRHLFISPDEEIELKDYGIETRKGIPESLFANGLQDSDNFKKVVEWINKNDLGDEGEGIFRKKAEGIKKLKLDQKQISVCYENNWLSPVLSDYVFSYCLEHQDSMKKFSGWLSKEREFVELYRSEIVQEDPEVDSNLLETCLDRDNRWLAELFCRGMYRAAVLNEDYFGDVAEAIDEYELADDIDLDIGKYGMKKLTLKQVEVCTKYKWLGEGLAGYLFRAAMDSENAYKKVIPWLRKEGLSIEYTRILDEYQAITFSKDMVKILCSKKWLMDIFNGYSFDRIFEGRSPVFKFESGAPSASDEFMDSIRQAVGNININRRFKEYLDGIGYSFLLMDIDDKCYFLTDRSVVLAKNQELAFAELCNRVDPDKTLIMKLANEGITKKLDDTDVSDSEYFKTIMNQRDAQYSSLADSGYLSNLTRIINEAGSNSNGFLSELIQNADDLKFDVGVVPEFVMELDGRTLTTYCNEIGFSKLDLRAITSIGESTKQRLSGVERETGEKGIGFKSVFSRADSVEIYSGDFNFRLTRKNPLVPDPLQRQVGGYAGTKMVFHLDESKEKPLNSVYNSDFIRQLCVGLKRLRHLKIFGIDATIEDGDDFRLIRVNGDDFKLGKYRYSFDVEDEELLRKRYPYQEKPEKKHNITIYRVPADKLASFDRNVYCTFPLKARSYGEVPLIIDAPFQLTTDRSRVFECEWSKTIRTQMYKAIEEVIKSCKGDYTRALDMVGFDVESKEFKSFTNSDFLNAGQAWKDALTEIISIAFAGSEEVRLLGKGSLIAPSFVHHICRIGKIDMGFFGKNVLRDITENSKLLPKFKALYCTNVDPSRIHDFMKEVCDRGLLSDEGGSGPDSVREKIYHYLEKKVDGFTPIPADYLLPIVPIKIESGVKFVPNGLQIRFTSDPGHVSDRYFQILDQERMSLETFQSVFSGCSEKPIQELRKAEYTEIYRKDLERFIEENQGNADVIIGKIRSEYDKNRSQLSECGIYLKNWFSLGRIPIPNRNGDYVTDIYRVKAGFLPHGHIMCRFIAPDGFQDGLLELLGALSLREIPVDAFRGLTDQVLEEDILDIFENVQNSRTVLLLLADAGCISRELAEKYGIATFVQPSALPYGNDVEIKARRVVDADQSRRLIQEQMRCPNRYVRRLTVRPEPERPIAEDTDEYLRSMYAGYDTGTGYSYRICQICKKAISSNHAQKTEIDSLPRNAWPQCHLLLCNDCADTYKMGRNSESFRSRLLKRIMETEIDGSGIVDVPLDDGSDGDSAITFTDVHLFDVKEIYGRFNPLSPENHRDRNDRDLPMVVSDEIRDELQEVGIENVSIKEDPDVTEEAGTIFDPVDPEEIRHLYKRYFDGYLMDKSVPDEDSAMFLKLVEEGERRMSESISKVGLDERPMLERYSTDSSVLTEDDYGFRRWTDTGEDLSPEAEDAVNEIDFLHVLKNKVERSITRESKYLDEDSGNPVCDMLGLYDGSKFIAESRHGSGADDLETLYEKAYDKYINKSYDKAVSLFIDSAKRGYLKSICYLGTIFRNSARNKPSIQYADKALEGYDQTQIAFYFYLLAAKEGYLPAMKSLSELYSEQYKQQGEDENLLNWLYWKCTFDAGNHKRASELDGERNKKLIDKFSRLGNSKALYLQTMI